jgi:TPR repeat protein
MASGAMLGFASSAQPTGLRILKPLAEGGYTRAQYSLGRLYATLPGGYRDDPEALRWYQAAAKRNHAQAQLGVGTRHMHGEQLPKDLNRAIEWLEKAAAQGVGQAAQSLGHIYENMLGNNADKEKAIEWYYRAAAVFQKSGHKDDAWAMIYHLKSLTDKHPAVLGLVAKLEKLVAGQG